MSAIDPSRRAFLRGHPRPEPALRPPWARDEASFVRHCVQCGDCLKACEMQVLRAGDGGFPEVDFSRGECTFCRACVDACHAPAFDLSPDASPWQVVATIGDACLGRQGVYCKNCGEACETGAIHFVFNQRRMPEPIVESDACTGCGACVAHCPVQAVKIEPYGLAVAG
ncbi:ferredoxin-type protein NapF [Halomonas sp. E19]|uniref:ferredoxin-type protein NapF n=1 Tax=unclassified Halomonas TaxID=2609666 RepID=UPI004034BD71